MAQNPITTIDAQDASIAAEAATKGDLAQLSPDQRTALYGATCRSMGLNPLSRPFEYIRLNNKLTLYATRTATDQLRKINGVSITKVEKEIFDGVLTVTVHAQDATGRTDMEIGAVMIGGLKGEALANAHMKALTKAKRRVTLSISGLGWLDETEVSSVPTASTVTVDAATGEIREPAKVTALPTPTADDRAEVAAVNRRLHAKASHAALHAWAESRGFISLSVVPLDDRTALADAFDIDGMADRFRVKYEPAPDIDIEPMPNDDPLSDELDAQQADLINDPELNAAADRIQRADRARQ